MPLPIIPANTRPMTIGVFPNMSGAVAAWQEPVTLRYIAKTLDPLTGEVQTVVTTAPSAANVQPIPKQVLDTVPEGMRAYRWKSLHFTVPVNLKLDDEVAIKGILYTVWKKGDWEEAQFYRYTVVEKTVQT